MSQLTFKEKQQAKLNVVANLCVQKIEDLFENLKVDVEISGDKYIGVCPIHGEADTPNALNIYYNGDTVPGYWKCRTHHCQNKFKPTIIGFTRGRLSSLKMKYHHKKNPTSMVTFPYTVNYLCNFLKINFDKIQVDLKEYEKLKFIRECNLPVEEIVHEGKIISRDKVRKNLIIPAEYFLDKGYDKEILNKYDVGVAKKSKIQTENRIIVPIYNQKNNMIGYTCRSIFDKCKKCKCHHDNNNECPKDKSLFSKWRHIDFNSEENLYNFWNAKKHIEETNTVILVEGPGDVWKLEQNGIHNSVAMFGNTLTEKQENLLASAQCMALIVLTDNDEAGLNGAKIIKQKFGRLYRMYFPNIEDHDVGDMNEDAITENIRPYLEKAKII